MNAPAPESNDPAPGAAPSSDHRQGVLPESNTAGARQAWLREPLLHFVLIGILLFALDHVLGLRRGDLLRVEVPEEAYIEARTLFTAQEKREPVAADMRLLIDRWIDNEVLYREGLALALDKGDPTIRERVIFKTLSSVQSGLSLPAYDEDTLKTWFEANRARYDEPQRLNFLEAVPDGDRGEDRLKAFVEFLNNGKSDAKVDSSLNVFKDRPRGSIQQAYGQEFTDALERAEPGKWVLLPSAAGQRVVQLQAVKPGKPADYAALRTEVMRDWKEQAMGQVTSRAIRELWRKYRIVRRGDEQ